MSVDRRLYWIWLQRHLPLGSMATNRLLDHFSDIEAVFAATPAALREVELRPQEYLELQDKDLTEAKEILKAMQDIGGWVLTPEDVCYPEALREIDGFPAVLYGEGTMPQLNRLPSVAVVGTRYATEEGKDNAYMLAGGLAAAGMVVVSGGARGIDAAAHAGALDAQGVTVLVKAAPPEVEYPQETAALRRHILEAGGAIVTEYAPGKPFFCDYHVRNRLMVGMTLGTCVVEAPQRSGALISANLARAQGKDLFAVPSSIRNTKNVGSLELIRKGAVLVTHAAELLEEYAGRFAGVLDIDAAEKAERALSRPTAPLPLKGTKGGAPHRPLPKSKTAEKEPKVADDTRTADLPAIASPQAQRLFAVIRREPCPVDLLAKRAGLPISETLVLLTELELYGCVKSTAGQQYYRT